MPNQEQQVVLAHFRAHLEEHDLIHDGDTIGTDDWTLTRFLHARQFDVEAAAKMWADCQHWRKTVCGVGIDELYEQMNPTDFPERREVFQYWPMWFHKTDKEGRPLSIQRYGKVDIPALYNTITPDRFWTYILTSAERIPREVVPAASKRAGKQVNGIFLIIDLKGYSLGQFWQMKGIAKDAFQVSQDYYPEMPAKFLIVNAPTTFTMIWSVLKRWLAPQTLEKMDVCGSDYKKVLLEHVSEENLPEDLGGTCQCEDFDGCIWWKE